MSSTALPAVDYDFSIEVRDPIKISALEEFTTLKAFITNTGDLDDTLDVTLEFDVPDTNWLVLFCLGNICFPPGVTQAPLPIASGALDSAYVDFTAFEVHGGATASLRFQSRGDPGRVETTHFAMITDSTDILIVDGDGGSPYESYYQDAVPDSYTRGIWDVSLEPVATNDLSLFDFTVWLTGERTPALTPEEMNTLADHLDGGGRLFISGQDIGRDIGGTDFYANYLHALLIADVSGNTVLDGIDGEPISDGLTLNIAGGDGANNQVSPSIVMPVPDGAFAHPTFYYGGTEEAAAISSVWFPAAPDSTFSTRVSYFAFGFEGINSQDDRNTVLQRVIEWLESTEVGIDCGCEVPLTGPVLPGAVVLRQNYPNPFNPSTTIAFSISERSNVELSIYDLRGRRIRTLIRGEISPGDHTVVWDGTDERGGRIGSGSYFYRITTNGVVVTRRMVVVK
jgi:hypothetical protein